MAQRWLNVICAGAGAGTLSAGFTEVSADAAPVSAATRAQATSLVYINVPLRFRLGFAVLRPACSSAWALTLSASVVAPRNRRPR
jgi:hypothetical protein